MVCAGASPKRLKPPGYRHLESQQPLVAQVDILLGLELDARVDLAGRLEVVQHQYVGIGGAAGLLETTVGLLQQPLQPLHGLADHAREDLDRDARGAGDRGRGQWDVNRLLRLQPAARHHCAGGFAVGQDLHLAQHRVAHLAARGRDLEVPQTEARHPDRDVGCGNLVGAHLIGQAGLAEQLEPAGRSYLQPDLLGLVQVVVDADRHLDLVPLGEEAGQIRFDKEILEHAQARFAAAQVAVLVRSHDADPPGGDGVRDGHLDFGATLPVGRQFRQPVEGLGEELAQARRTRAG